MPGVEDRDVAPEDLEVASEDISSIAGEELLPTGYLRDFISGVQIKATPEEVEAVQVFSRRLVEDFGFPKSCITTRPQYRVRRRPSEERKSYPVDIAVFSNDRRTDSDLLMVVECKAESVKDGRKQLEIYLTMSDATIGVWFNGREHLYLRKDYVEGGRSSFSLCQIFHDLVSGLKTLAFTFERPYRVKGLKVCS